MDEALVVGSGCGVWEDYRLGTVGLTAPEVFAVNIMTLLLPLVHHAVSHNAAAIIHMTRARKTLAVPVPYETETHSSEFHAAVDHVWRDLRDLGADSGLLAVQIALRLGAQRVVVLGIPLDERGHVYDDPASRGAGHGHTNYRHLWRKVMPDLAGRVFGVSGFLRELLGPPPSQPRITAGADVGGRG